MLEDGRARLEVVLEADRVEQRPAAHARAPRGQRQVPRLPQGQGAARRSCCSAWAARRSSTRRMREFLPAWVGEAIAEARLQPPTARASTSRRCPARASRSRSRPSSRCGRRARCPTELELEGVQEDVEVPAEEVDAELERLREESSPLVDGRARRADRRLRRGRHARQRRAASRCPTASTVGYLVQLGTRPDLRGDRARAARHDRRRDAHDRAAAARRLPRRRSCAAATPTSSCTCTACASGQPRPLDDELRARRLRVRHPRRAARGDRGELPRAARGARPLALPRQRARRRSARPSRSICRRTSWPAASRS